MPAVRATQGNRLNIRNPASKLISSRKKETVIWVRHKKFPITQLAIKAHRFEANILVDAYFKVVGSKA